MFRNIVIAALASLLLAGCASGTFKTIGDVFSIASKASVPASSVLVASNGFAIVERTATNYLGLPACSGSKVTPICKTVPGAKAIKSAMATGIDARNTLIGLLKNVCPQIFPAADGTPADPSATCTAAIPVASYDTLNATIGTLQRAFLQYGVTG